MEDKHKDVAEARIPVPRVGCVIEGPGPWLPYSVVDSDGIQVSSIESYLTDLVLGDARPSTVRSYAYDLLRWFRLMWFLGISWEKATESETFVLVSSLRNSQNPQRRRRRKDSAPAGSLNSRTGKASLAAGYASSTINHALSSLSSFYSFHAQFGVGPVRNPVPVSADRRRALSHHSPLEPAGQFRRARMRQRETTTTPRAIPDAQWNELFASMRTDRNRALLTFYASSGARASELLGVRTRDVDWAGQRIYVISKGTGLLEPVPASPEAFLYLASYLDRSGVPGRDEHIWRTEREPTRPLEYSAMRRVVQRANETLGTNWTLHDLRHTAASRMANDPKLTLPEVQTILRHAHLSTTERYLAVRVEDLFNKMQEHYSRPRPERRFNPGYNPDDIQAVFGA